MDQREFNNGMNKFDALDTEGGDVAALLGALPRVEAPKNFEFRVKAGIAEGSAPRGRLIPFLKLAAPLSLVLVVAGFVIFYGTLPTPNERFVGDASVRNEAPITEPQAETPVVQPATLSGPQLSEPPVVQPERASVETDRPGPVKRTTNSVTLDRSQGGSVDQTLGSANTILPRGFESVVPGSRNLNANAGAASADVPVRSVLGILGITADFADRGWKVQSVAENSVASRSSVRSGDVIEAIDGQQLKGDSVIKGSAKTLTIRRDGKTINVDLTN